MYVEVFAKYHGVISLLETFGFEATTNTTSRGEKVLVKKMSFSQADFDGVDPLEFNIRFGPTRVKFVGAQAFVVPIRPDYHKVLFPSEELQQELFRGVHPSGNAIRKAYLCHSRLRKMKPGAVLLFYRSKDTKAICSLGVAEAFLRSSDPMDIARFVGTRTVYPYDRIKKMCSKPILAVLFRHAYSLPIPIDLSDLTDAGALKSAPQSIVAINNKGISWLQNRLQL